MSGPLPVSKAHHRHDLEDSIPLALWQQSTPSAPTARHVNFTQDCCKVCQVTCNEHLDLFKEERSVRDGLSWFCILKDKLP
jgi:hypothetical protein